MSSTQDTLKITTQALHEAREHADNMIVAHHEEIRRLTELVKVISDDLFKYEAMKQ